MLPSSHLLKIGNFSNVKEFLVQFVKFNLFQLFSIHYSNIIIVWGIAFVFFNDLKKQFRCVYF